MIENDPIRVRAISECYRKGHKPMRPREIYTIPLKEAKAWGDSVEIIEVTRYADAPRYVTEHKPEPVIQSKPQPAKIEPEIQSKFQKLCISIDKTIPSTKDKRWYCLSKGQGVEFPVDIKDISFGGVDEIGIDRDISEEEKRTFLSWLSESGRLVIKGKETVKQKKNPNIGCLLILQDRKMLFPRLQISDDWFFLDGLRKALNRNVKFFPNTFIKEGFNWDIPNIGPKSLNSKDFTSHSGDNSIFVADFENQTSINAFLEFGHKNGYQVVFVQDCRSNPELLKEIKSFSRYLVVRTNDFMQLPERKERFSKVCEIADYVITTGEDVKWGGSKHICARQGTHPLVHQRFDVPKIYDINFTGNLYFEERRAFLQKIADRFEIHIFSQHTPNYQSIADPNWIMHDPIAALDRAKVYSQSKIVLGDKFGAVNDYSKEGIDYYWSNRIYQAIGSGAFFLTPYIKGLEEEFTNKEHIVWAKNMDELLELIDYYLKHDEEREKIADNGYKIAHSKYSYDNRTLGVIEKLRLKGVEI